MHIWRGFTQLERTCLSVRHPNVVWISHAIQHSSSTFMKYVCHYTTDQKKGLRLSRAKPTLLSALPYFQDYFHGISPQNLTKSATLNPQLPYFWDTLRPICGVLLMSENTWQKSRIHALSLLRFAALRHPPIVAENRSALACMVLISCLFRDLSI